MEILKNTDLILNLMDNSISNWHKIDGKEPDLNKLPIRRKFNEKSEFLLKVLEILEANYNLWHLEDLARDKTATDNIIAEVKRRIDKENQLRNDRIEQLDILIDMYLKKNRINPNTNISNSETIGSIIDRLTILSLKIYHMFEQTLRKDVVETHIENCKNRLNILKIQRDDLAQALKILIDEILTGKKRHKIYYQFKMYNDPNLNPVLYRKNG